MQKMDWNRQEAKRCLTTENTCGQKNGRKKPKGSRQETKTNAACVNRQKGLKYII